MANYTIIARSVSGFGATYEVDKYPRSKAEVLTYAESDGYVLVYRKRKASEGETDHGNEYLPVDGLKLVADYQYTPESGGHWFRAY
ncbi:MAG: hypothetical protein FWG94_08170 [Oscillospiraceae bacterium]|nr:hypothetical protein [Oscillospiraceae bacterium]